MSGLISTVATVGGVATAAADIFGIGASTITLGNITFKDLALPEKMRWGGFQRITRQFSPGSTITLNDTGTDWEPMRWSGILEGPTAGQDAMKCYTAMRAGQRLTLNWMEQTWTVQIRRFYCEDQTSAWRRYDVTCEVLGDASSIDGPPAPPSLGQQIVSDINSALGFNIVDAAGQAATVLGQASAAAGLVGAFTKGTAAFGTLSNALGTASGVVGGAITLANTGISALGTAVSGAQAALSWVSGAVMQTGNLANAVTANGFIGRAATNQDNAST